MTIQPFRPITVITSCTAIFWITGAWPACNHWNGWLTLQELGNSGSQWTLAATVTHTFNLSWDMRRIILRRASHSILSLVLVSCYRRNIYLHGRCGRRWLCLIWVCSTAAFRFSPPWVTQRSRDFKLSSLLKERAVGSIAVRSICWGLWEDDKLPFKAESDEDRISSKEDSHQLTEMCHHDNLECFVLVKQGMCHSLRGGVSRERKSERIDQKPGFLPGPADVWFHAVFQSLWKSHHPPLPLLWDLEEARILGLEGQSSLHFVKHQTVVGLMKDVKLNEVLVEYPPGWTSSSQFCHWLVGLAHALTIGVWQKHWSQLRAD